MYSGNVLKAFESIETPFYYYDIDLLRKTLSTYSDFIRGYGYQAHYALKANAEPRILEEVRNAGLGADCVSGNEVKLALKSGFSPRSIVYAGVGKSDREIREALEGGIFSFNCESVPEIQVIGELASAMGKEAHISLRVNPDIDAHTHRYISTGREEDKFGISPWMFDDVYDVIHSSSCLKLEGLHFHIGSQITQLEVFGLLCRRVEELQNWFVDKGIAIDNINLGGGLGVDYEHPSENPVADFRRYFDIIHSNLKLRPGQRVHFEPGRAIVAQCGSLISRVLYVKVGKNIRFVILDAGMNDLIRPALYGARHKIENLVSDGASMKYDVVGPVCESSDTWGRQIDLPPTRRGDLFAIRTAGAYGQVMAMKYNQRDLAKAYYSDDLIK